jgi:uncharacterized membrane protein
MSANVFFWIIPGQKKVVSAMTQGLKLPREELMAHGKRGKQRSVHNTYFTLPVIFSMLSNHYGFLYSAEHNWLILFVLMLAGALIRQYFVQRHAFLNGRAKNPFAWAVVGSLVIVAVIIALAPRPSKTVATPKASSNVNINISSIIEQRCAMCHNAQVQMKNVRLDSPELQRAQALAIYQQVVVQRLMPMNNSTGITEEERAQIKLWYESLSTQK